jgi:hypothetical protein
VFAERVNREGGDDDFARIEWAFRMAVQREPTSYEIVVLGDILDYLHYEQHPEAAADVVASGQAPSAAGLDPVHVAAWTAVTRTLLNLDETITRP